MTPARLRWGLILVQLGILILLVNVEILNYNFVPDLVRAFPFFLIAIGVEKIFTRSKAELVSYLTVSVMFLAGLSIAYEGSNTENNSSFWEKTTYREKLDPNIKTLQALVDLDGRDLTIRDATDALVYGKFAEFTVKPTVNLETSGESARVEFVSNTGLFYGSSIAIDTDRSDDWSLYFCRTVPLDLECLGDDSEIHLNLATTPLRKLTLDADDSDIYAKIGDMEPEVDVIIDGDDADLRLRLPKESGVRIKSSEFASYLERIGLTERGEGYVNDGYDSLPNKVEIQLDDRIDNLKVEFY